MERSDDRPSANARPPDLSQPLEVTQALLEIEWARLKVAQRIEKERSIVFPETTVIIRDIQKLQTVLIRLKETAPRVVSDDSPAETEEAAAPVLSDEITIPQLD